MFMRIMRRIKLSYDDLVKYIEKIVILPKN